VRPTKTYFLDRVNITFRIDKLEFFFVVIREFSWLEENLFFLTTKYHEKDS
jgi:hypothetical protein